VAILALYRFRGWLARPTVGRAYRYTVAIVLADLEIIFQFLKAHEFGFHGVPFAPRSERRHA
jgi:hypothetical protein